MKWQDACNKSKYSNSNPALAAIPKVTVEIAGADRATRNVIEDAIVKALYNIAPEVTVK